MAEHDAPTASTDLVLPAEAGIQCLAAAPIRGVAIEVEGVLGGHRRMSRETSWIRTFAEETGRRPASRMG